MTSHQISTVTVLTTILLAEALACNGRLIQKELWASGGSNAAGGHWGIGTGGQVLSIGGAIPGGTAGSPGYGGSDSGGSPTTTTNNDDRFVATAITAGFFHVCALLEDGSVRCWGTNAGGQLGLGSSRDNGGEVTGDDPEAVSLSLTPVRVIGIDNANAISGADCSTCALLNSRAVKCWGNNYGGALGSGSSTPIIPTPVSVLDVSDAVAIATGDSHGCAMLSNGQLKCWGLNLYGELGDGTDSTSSVPVAVRGIGNAVAIAAGGGVDGAHTCAIVSGGRVSCWGYNGDGELGNGGNTDSSTPIEVVGLTSASAIAAGDSHTCALVSGIAKCWGKNNAGQLGDGTTTNSTLPVAVSGITNAIAVAGGDTHTCAVLSTGTVMCWGLNDWGQLGNGTTNGEPPYGSSIPTPVSGIDDAIAVTAGSEHACALLANGSVRCWGHNNYGELGNGTRSDSNVPVPVTGF